VGWTGTAGARADTGVGKERDHGAGGVCGFLGNVVLILVTDVVLAVGPMVHLDAGSWQKSVTLLSWYMAEHRVRFSSRRLFRSKVRS
jgi:hypothetical protein